MAVVAVRTYMEITQCSEYDLYRLQLSLELKMIMHSAVWDSVRLSGWSNETKSKTFSGDHDGVGDSSHQPQPQPQPLYYFGFIRLTERTRLSRLAINHGCPFQSFRQRDWWFIGRFRQEQRIVVHFATDSHCVSRSHPSLGRVAVLYRPGRRIFGTSYRPRVGLPRYVRTNVVGLLTAT